MDRGGNAPGSLDGKNVIVVGGAGLLGGRICDAIVAAGARCTIADISTERATLVADEIEKTRGYRPYVREVSIVVSDSIDALIRDGEAEFGRIDGFVNTSYPRNGNYGRKFEEVTYSDFCENVNLHLGGYFLCSQRILEYFKRNGGGILLNMSSIYGVVAPRFGIYTGTSMTMPVEYAAIKAALVHLTKYMARYYAGNGIRVNCLSLGGLEAGQQESFTNAYREYCLDKGMLDPEDITGCVTFLLSDASRYINGQNIIVDDGFVL
jgi:NAD(P)-dependent dehydrogenase (short-subunit alcohol dehydrogenase family)